MTVSTHKTFTFDTEKWLENRGLHRCSRVTRSVVIDMMVYSVKHNGTFRIDEKSAIRIGATAEEWAQALDEIIRFNVTEILDGLITFNCISSFIEKKEKISQKRRESAESRWGKDRDSDGKQQEEIPFDANACNMEVTEATAPKTCPFAQYDTITKMVVCKCIKPQNIIGTAQERIISEDYRDDTTGVYNNIYNNKYNFRKGVIGGKPFVEDDTSELPVQEAIPVTTDSLVVVPVSKPKPRGDSLLSRMVVKDFGIPVFYDENGRTGNSYIDDLPGGCNYNPAEDVETSGNGICSLSEGETDSELTRCMDGLKKRLKKPVLNDSEERFCEWWNMYPVSRRRGGSMEAHYKLWEKNCKGNEEQVLAYAEDYLFEFNEGTKEEKYCMHSIRFLRTMDWENFVIEDED